MAKKKTPAQVEIMEPDAKNTAPAENQETESQSQVALVPASAPVSVALAQSNAVMSMIERIVKDPTIDIDRLDKMIGLQERMIQTQAKADYDAAFADMQGELPEISKNGKIAYENDKGDKIEKGKYAKFEHINEVIKPILKRFGFAVSFRIDQTNLIKVTGILSHRAGHREETSFTLAADPSGKKNAPQSMGSSVSYGKRYVLCALLNITTRDEDDDGEAADGFITRFQVETLEDVLADCPADARERFALKFGAIEEVRRSQFKRVMEFAQETRGGKKAAELDDLLKSEKPAADPQNPPSNEDKKRGKAPTIEEKAEALRATLLSLPTKDQRIHALEQNKAVVIAMTKANLGHLVVKLNELANQGEK